MCADSANKFRKSIPVRAGDGKQHEAVHDEEERDQRTERADEPVVGGHRTAALQQYRDVIQHLRGIGNEQGGLRVSVRPVSADDVALSENGNGDVHDAPADLADAVTDAVQLLHDRDVEMKTASGLLEIPTDLSQRLGNVGEILRGIEQVGGRLTVRGVDRTQGVRRVGHLVPDHGDVRPDSRQDRRRQEHGSAQEQESDQDLNDGPTADHLASHTHQRFSK